MTAASKDRAAYERAGGGRYRHIPVAASEKIYAGTHVCFNATGYAVSGEDAADLTYAGVAAEYADNTSGADGAIYIKVWCKGVFRFAYNPGDAARTNIGDKVYVMDDSTVATAASMTHDILCGRIHDYVDASNVDVDIEHTWS